MDQKDIFHTLSVDIDLNDDVGAGIYLTNVTYFQKPVFANRSIIETEADRARFVNVKTNRYYNAEVTGLVDLGMTGGTELDLTGLISTQLENILLSLGIVETSGLTIGYRLLAKLDMLDLTQSELSLTFYVLDGPGSEFTNNNVFLFAYINVFDDALYLDLSRLDAIKEKAKLLNMIGTLPKLKISNLGIKEMLSEIDIISSLNFANSINLAVNNGFYVTNPVNSTGDLLSALFLGGIIARQEQLHNEEGDGSSFDIMSLIGKAIGGITIDSQINALTVALNAQILSILMSSLLSTNIAMPLTQGSIKIQLIGVDNSEPGGDGYISLKLAILDTRTNQTKAFYIDASLLHSIRLATGDRTVTIPSKDGSTAFQKSEYIDFKDYLAGMTVGFSTEGGMALTVSEGTNLNAYVSEYINGFLGNLIQGLGVRFKFNSNTIFDLQFAIKANINLSVTTAPTARCPSTPKPCSAPGWL